MCSAAVRHYLIRRSKYEALAHRMLAGLMPLIYRYMEAERSVGVLDIIVENMMMVMIGYITS